MYFISHFWQCKKYTNPCHSLLLLHLFSWSTKVFFIKKLSHHSTSLVPIPFFENIVSFTHIGGVTRLNCTYSLAICMNIINNFEQSCIFLSYLCAILKIFTYFFHVFICFTIYFSDLCLPVNISSCFLASLGPYYIRYILSSSKISLLPQYVPTLFIYILMFI